MRYFLSKEARLFTKNSDNLSNKSLLDFRATLDQAVLMFPVSYITNCNDLNIIERKATMKDFPGIRLSLHLEGYAWITEQYVTHDYTRIELLKLAQIVAAYDERIIKIVGNRCKGQKHFTIPYLAAALENEASELIEELRREERMDQLIADTPELELPPYQQFKILERSKEIGLDHQIDRALRGHKA